MVWKKEESKGNEQDKIKWEIVPYTRGRGLDLGCGPNKAFPHFIGVDNGHHERFGYSIKPDMMVETCEKLDIFASQSMDFVFSSHLLEHIQDYKAALREWFRLVKVGGYLVLYYPHKLFYPNVGKPGANPDHKHDFLPQDIIDAMEALPGAGWDLVENQERNGGDEYSAFQVFRKIGANRHLQSWKRERPAKTAAVIRYGAFGDLMQASSVIAGLKRAGYHVTLFSSPPGSDVIKHDPNIDELILQDKDQVPNTSLVEFWRHLKTKYDKFVNLSESVEGAWLALPGSSRGEWPHEIRHKRLNTNYLEFQHELAGVPHVPAVKFYATDEEKQWAKKQRSKMAETVVLWQMVGSSIHKVWPFVDNIIARLMITFSDLDVVLTGGPDAAFLQEGWQNEKRVIKTMGKWSIRETLAFVQQADLIVGPETGVLNAASCLSVPKICILSHSSVENLTRDWVNTVSIAPKNTSCYPCHMMHYKWDSCRKGVLPGLEDREEKDGIAACQIDIGIDQVWEPIEAIITRDMLRVA